MSEQVVIAIDIGTTSTKILAYDKAGNTWAEEEQEYPLYTPHPGWKEQDPEEIFQSMKTALRLVLKAVEEKDGIPGGVGFSAAMHSLIAMDESGNPLTGSLTWADQRSVEETEELKNGEGHAIYLRTGTPIHPMSPLTKLLWFRKHDSDTFERASKWISIKEYVFYRLFDRYIVDYSIASATGLFNLEQLDWDEKALALTGISKKQLSNPVPTTHLVSGLSVESAKELGLPADIPFVIGASDGVLANLGVGAIEPGSVACSIGTSGAIRTVVSKPSVDPKGRIFCYALTDDQWVIGGPINNGGITFRWARDNLFPDIKKQAKQAGRDPYDDLAAIASKVKPGSDGLLFFPYLTGERAPYWNADTKGVFFGLTLDHSRDQMIRSVLEGVIFQMYTVVIALIEAGVEPVEFRANGGFARSELWRQIMADIFETEIIVPESHQSSCMGAAWLTMYKLGMVERLSDIKELVKTKVKHAPVKANSDAYNKLKPLFIRLARDLQSDFGVMADIQRQFAEEQT
ncbi:gluconokinase [Sediminibacillus halophilus]|uniref:Gluconokinase n=1 Tax=Sediminibacillus halophilus TaxID=482461 RepID=A0A1G9RKP1_9BACI|nr:gluconokinase [Sediminibacillus halophilus]SDM23788.1 gluconokinase [Sediminibacillus halophilus]